MRKTPVAVTLSPFEHALLRALARGQDRSLSYIVGLCIEKYAYREGPDGQTELSAKVLEEIAEKTGMAKTGTEG